MPVYSVKVIIEETVSARGETEAAEKAYNGLSAFDPEIISVHEVAACEEDHKAKRQSSPEAA